MGVVWKPSGHRRLYFSYYTAGYVLDSPGIWVGFVEEREEGREEM